MTRVVVELDNDACGLGFARVVATRDDVTITCSFNGLGDSYSGPEAAARLLGKFKAARLA
jgi:hypothetical protein